MDEDIMDFLNYLRLVADEGSADDETGENDKAAGFQQ